MATGHRVLAVGGDRPVLVGLSKAFLEQGALFAATSDPAKMLESAARFSPHLVLVFARTGADDAMKRVSLLRSDQRFAKIPIVVVTSLPPKNPAGATMVVPDPSDPHEFATRLMKGLFAPAVSPIPEVIVEIGGDDDPVSAELPIVEDIHSEPARVLLVDDDPSLIRLFSLVLTKSGFEVDTAPDGEDGLLLALEKRPDLVVADLNMPRMDGWGLLRALRADHRVGETPVMFLSCHDDYRESLKALSAGAQDYVAKGGKLDALVARIRRLLAPRDALASSLRAGERALAKVEQVGVQWALRQMDRANQTGLVRVSDAFWRIEISVRGGEIHSAHAQIGEHHMDGDAAVPPLVVFRAGDLLFDPAAPLPAGNTRGRLSTVVEAAALKNNMTEAEALDRLLTTAKRVEIDEQLYLLYEQLGPPASRDIAALVKQGLTPRDIIGRTERSPLDVEETVRDLIRRRVVRLTA